MGVIRSGLARLLIIGRALSHVRFITSREGLVALLPGSVIVAPIAEQRGLWFLRNALLPDEVGDALGYETEWVDLATGDDWTPQVPALVLFSVTGPDYEQARRTMQVVP